MKASYTTSRREGCASHNDRTFDLSKADHIDLDKMEENRYWCIYDNMTFEEAERAFYKSRYKEMIEEQNKNRSHLWNLEDYLKKDRYCPEEIILQIGNVNDSPSDRKVFDDCFDTYLSYINEWNREHGNHMHILNYAVHKDEANIHAHIRRVWDYEDKDGKLRIGLDGALKQSGVTLPFPEKPEGHHNNRKIMFDRMMRSKWIDICKEHGLEIDNVPGKDKHLRICDYKRNINIREINQAKENIQMVSSLVEQTMKEIPENRLAPDQKGQICVWLSSEEFENESGRSKSSELKKEEEKELRKKLNCLSKEQDLTREAIEKKKQEISAIEQDMREIKESAMQISGQLLEKAMTLGTEAYNRPDETLRKFLESSNYPSIIQAMDAMEEKFYHLERKAPGFSHGEHQENDRADEREER